MWEEYTKSNGFIRKNKNILFLDFNGVISYDPFWKTLRDEAHPLHAYSDKIENHLFKENVSVVVDWMTGLYTSEDVHRLLESTVGVPYDQLFPIFQDECANLDISSEILRKVQDLRDYYTCILATDNMDSFRRFTLAHHPELAASFDHIDDSYTMKRSKKSENGRYFKERIAEHDAVAENCILIDDSKNNCATFESLGGKAYPTKTEDQVLAVLDQILATVQRKWEWQY